MLVDEGCKVFVRFVKGKGLSQFTAGFEDRYGSVFAIPGVAERGIFDVRLDVAAPGGHSSLPPKHTVSSSVLCAACKLIAVREEHWSSLRLVG